MQKAEARHRDTAERRTPKGESRSRAGGRGWQGASWPFAARRRSQAAGLLCLAGAVAFVYAPVLGFDFVSWDDPWYVSRNPHVLGGLGWSGAWWAFNTGGDFYWHPLTWLSHQLDVTLFGVNAGWHHATNVVLHAANALLLFGLVEWACLNAPTRKPPAPFAFALVAAGLFALHPLRVESVAWVAERKDVLSGLFWMLTIAAYFYYVQKPGWRRYVLVAAAFGLGLMAKPMIVTLPVVLLLLDVWPLRRWTHVGPQASGLGPQASRASLLVEKLPLLLLGAAVAVATLLVQAQAGAVGALSQLSLQYRVSNALVSYVAYLGKMFWPVNLAAFYPYPAALPAPWLVGLSAGVVASMLVAAFKLAGTRPYVTTGLLWYLVTLLPVSGLFQAGDQLMADRFTYLPSIGIVLMVVWGGGDLVAAVKPRLAARQRWIPSAVAALVALAALLGCAVVSRAQVAHWRNSETLWTHALAVTTGNHRAHAGLAEWQAEHGRMAEATANYREAVRLAPAGADYRHALGMILVSQGMPAEGARELAVAVRLDPRHVNARVSLGAVLARQGRSAEAVEQYAEALRLRPEMPQALSGLGSALIQQGRFQEAARACLQAAELDRTSFDARMCAGLAFARLGRATEAASEFFGATERDPSSEAAWVNLGIAFTQGAVDRKADAIAAFERALRINPSNDAVRNALAELRK